MSPATLGELIEQLRSAGRDVVAQNMVLASGGNVSARAPDGSGFLVSGTGAWLDRLTPESFAVVGLDGSHRSGPAPSVEWRLHLLTYLARPDIRSVVHVHPQTTILLDALDLPIRLITSDHVLYLRKLSRVPFFPAGSPELADAVSAASREANIVLMAHHGCSALGDTVEMALRRALNLEEAAQLTYRALLLGNRDLTFPAEWVDAITKG